MALHSDNDQKIEKTLEQHPQVSIFLKPIAPPAALALAGFSGSTFITSAWIAGWYGDSESPLIFFPFVAFFGGLSQFIAGLMGYQARDVLVTVINTMWGAFWMSIGLPYAFVAAGAIPAHSIDTHFPEFGELVCGSYCIYMVRSIGNTIAIRTLFASGPGVGTGMKAAAYFWLLSALLAWWRPTVYLIEEAYGPSSAVAKLFPTFRTSHEKKAPLIVPGLGEPGAKRGMPGVN
ncbi:hypothetical protein LTR24_007964 [Lithohypha guttulata]|uniref:Uncharacterized protein n=1 Tax=Lithohypha guttulata TaxID=1690604 RepID=A0ABR0K212_9EURO|nr:hypothetical protein LTR24_007964 [Lithohypha guttulata]